MNLTTLARLMVLAGIASLLGACATSTQLAPIESRQTASPAGSPNLAEPAAAQPQPAGTRQPVPETRVFALPDDGVAPMAPVPAPGAAVAPPAPVDPALRDLVAQADRATTRGDRGAARATLERALKIKPADPDLWLRLGELNLEDGEFEQAIVMSQRARDLARGDPLLLARADALARRAEAALNR